jgi:hypothetical protein
MSVGQCGEFDFEGVGYWRFAGDERGPAAGRVALASGLAKVR